MITKDWAATDPGTARRENEDALLRRPELGLFVVADGAGGHASGALASGMIVEQLNRLSGDVPSPELVCETLQNIHAQLHAAAAARGSEVVIASTVIALILQASRFICLWAGDSRLYLLREQKLRQITKDHSLVQELIDQGALPPAAAEQHPRANVITRAVGAAGLLEIDEITGMAAPGDRFLLCSDGISKTLSLDEMREILSATDATPPQRLIDAARARHVRDNVTAIVVDLLPQPGP